MNEPESRPSGYWVGLDARVVYPALLSRTWKAGDSTATGGKAMTMQEARRYQQQQKGRIIFRPWITVKGRRIYARDYGFRAFPIRVLR